MAHWSLDPQDWDPEVLSNCLHLHDAKADCWSILLRQLLWCWWSLHPTSSESILLILCCCWLLELRAQKLGRRLFLFSIQGVVLHLPWWGCFRILSLEWLSYQLLFRCCQLKLLLWEEILPLLLHSATAGFAFVDCFDAWLRASWGDVLLVVTVGAVEAVPELILASKYKRLLCFRLHFLQVEPLHCSLRCPGRSQLKQSPFVFINWARSCTESALKLRQW